MTEQDIFQKYLGWRTFREELMIRPYTKVLDNVLAGMQGHSLVLNIGQFNYKMPGT